MQLSTMESLNARQRSKRSLWAIIAAALILAGINYKIYQQEQLLAHGEIVLFELAPVDPRSLMQGDYMALNYDIAREVSQSVDELSNTPENYDGFFIVTLDQNRIAQFDSIYNGAALTPAQRLIQYRVRDGRVKLASNAFFFQEGRAEEFEQAKYGEFRVNQAGQLLLSNMINKDFKRI
ncbi:GDYXXLXY domain-containing protein [Shewanella ulleungensis]|uniref:Membrane protein n=1 Tax=Shewanella ulleungensis TaxID=2282699 RepID=A0ABQ2QEY6_9GAMM|nr:GDYXXLXY domain-containing protein [Shewanella ulleungensis]MCL1149429.1 GDYXXLXY domain-containing protein [Shewanella ulleungensis]GGP79065.1 membrane protein [Shewanella ulleungensis]